MKEKNKKEDYSPFKITGLTKVHITTKKIVNMNETFVKPINKTSKQYSFSKSIINNWIKTIIVINKLIFSNKWYLPISFNLWEKILKKIYNSKKLKKLDIIDNL